MTISSSCMATPSDVSYVRVCDWSNLLQAEHKAAKGKRSGKPAAAFEYHLADNLLELQQELLAGSWRPGGYTHFYIHEPKRRRISAAPFRDRVVHHALCNVIEPVFEQLFIPDSYANRVGKGTHRAVDRLQQFCQRYPYVLRLDIVKHFPAMDHDILFNTLERYLFDEQILRLVRTIIDSGKNVQDQGYTPVFFPGDDLLSMCRPRGLPIGNLTSQFWSNCYLHPLDLFIKRELGCKGYLRYVDDFAMFVDSKARLWEWKQAVREKLYGLRLRFHEDSAQVTPVTHGIPWLGFVVYPTYRRVKQRKVVNATQRLNQRFAAWRNGDISFAEFDASIKGWINHVRYADSWGLRKHVLKPFRW